MDFLKNINKEHVLISDYNFIKKNYHYLFEKGDDINLGTIKVKTNDLNMNEAEFYITKMDDIDEVVTQVADLMIKKLTRDASKYKKIAKKVVEAWNTSPERFNKQEKSYSGEIYKRTGLLNNKEYMHSVSIFFDRVSYYSDYGFVTGCGGDTYYAKEVHEENLESIDKWIANVTKELASEKIKKRLKNYIMKSTIIIPIDKLDESITLATNEIKVSNSSSNSKKKPAFPVKFTANELNTLLSNFPEACIDQELIDELKSQYFKVDMTPLLDWEIYVEHEGFHHNDGQVCDYTATFTHPDGHEYYIYNSHSLMTGWNLCEDEEAELT